ncbi:efflux RND transporter periplasmic adaptor subunit [Varunaivibrio sulfuroxidans]|uniref:Membrane fusion protein (Multidrug efflux system) n=1 Tax=Varunaivibrio sulfuroxidans TaxID=1773489 RepID=A0A4R3JFR4_9PROT|nr:efflux RND transporter periplasmic adaptor subunit [Varunaivibrio sulfuroxidans]TCS64687.1 membrane fusion protein (multidrug efflux system) [Varunaivibrio sulfuroxidans]WES30006.1 efflux RND transporter periplasmic adaptor subunit [Varunaivibrio sulfuroxidans]
MVLDSSRRFAAVFVLALASAFALEPAISSAQMPQKPPPPVSVITVEVRPVPLVDILPGRTVAYGRAEVRPQVAGLIQKRLFEEGSNVHAGQPLYRIDPDTYRAAVDVAQADVAKSRASYASSQKKLERYKSLLRTQAVSRQVYDDAVAAVAQDRAGLDAAQAHLETAKINLRRTTITAPITGLIGRSEVTEGGLVTADQATPLATITALDPIYVDLTESNTRVLDLREKIARGIVEKTPSVPVTLLLDSQGTVYAHKGILQFSEAVVDPSTGTVGSRAVFPNPDHVLLPGMFVRAEVSRGVVPKGALIPQKAVVRTPDGSPYVWVVGDGDTIARRDVTIERAIGENWLVTGGVTSGDRVVVDGAMNVAVGAKVTVHDLATKALTPPTSESAAAHSTLTPR